MKKSSYMLSRLKSFKHAFNGLFFMMKYEVNAKIHFLAAVVASLLGYFLELSNAEWLWIALSITLVFVLEIINTAIEKLCDLVDPEYNLSIKHIKNMAAGAVIVGAIFSLVVAVVIFLPKILEKF